MNGNLRPSDSDNDVSIEEENNRIEDLLIHKLHDQIHQSTSEVEQLRKVIMTIWEYMEYDWSSYGIKHFCVFEHQLFPVNIEIAW